MTTDTTETPTLEAFADDALMAAERMCRGGGVYPHFALLLPDRQLLIAPLEASLMGSGTYERWAADTMRRKMKELGVLRYAVITEAWLVRAIADDAAEEPSPSERPDRIEAVVIEANERGRCVLRFRRIVRDPATGKVLDVVAIPWAEDATRENGGKIESAFFGLLDD